jgi:hypothetical protein
LRPIGRPLTVEEDVEEALVGRLDAEVDDHRLSPVFVACLGVVDADFLTFAPRILHS